MNGILTPVYRHFEGLAGRIRDAVPMAGLRKGEGASSLLLRFGIDPHAKFSRGQMLDFHGGNRLAANAAEEIARGQLMSVIPASFFQTPDWTVFGNELKGVQEVVRWPLYAYKAYATGGHTTLLFFDQTEGNATNGRLDTNAVVGGSLAGNQMQVIVGIGVEPIPSQLDVFVANGLTPAGIQWYNVLQNGWLEAVISGKEYMVGAPLTRFPAGFGFGTFVNGTTVSASQYNATHLNNGSPDNRAKFNMDPPLGILPNRPFKFQMRWNTAVTVTTAGRMGIGLEGWLIRAAL